MQTIISTIFVITLSSSNRLLLQTQPQPQFIPITDLQPVNPAAGVGGGQPTNPAVGVGVGGGQQQQQPSGPAVGGTPPATGTPGNGVGVGGGGGGGVGAVTPAGPPVWVPPAIPSLQAMQQQTILECTRPNTDPAGCAGRVQRITNPAQDFACKCLGTGGCAQTKFEFIYKNSRVERVGLLEFGGVYGGYQASVTIDSTESLMKQYVDVCKCGGFGACNEMNFYLVGGSSMNDMQCDPLCSNCQDCWIHEECTRNPIAGQPPICVYRKPCCNY